MADSLQQTLADTQTKLFSTPGVDIAPANPQPDAWSVVQDKRKREAAMAAESSVSMDGGVHMGSYLGAMWRQDSPVDGIVANHIGNQMAPVPGYVAAADPKAWEGLTAGISPDFHKEFNDATSPAHAEYIRGRLLQKQDDLVNLGDLGAYGIAGRLMFGLVEPSSALAMVLSGGVAGAVKGTAVASKALNAGRAAQDIVAMEAATKALATAAGTEGTAAARAAGTAGAFGFNAAFEQVRQSVNFESDNAAVLEAGLLGTALAAPFVHLHSREMTKLSETANVEQRVLAAIRKDREGAPLTPADQAAVGEHAALKEAVVEGETMKGGSAGAAQAQALGIDPVYMASGRMDISATLNKQPNKVLQELGFDLVKDAIGNSKFYAQGRSASESKALIKRVLGGYFHRESTDAFNEVRKIRGLGILEASRQHQQFFEDVTMVARGDTQVLIDNPDIAGPLNKAAAAMRHTFDEMGKRAIKSGLEGAENLTTGGTYVNRVWNHDNIRSAVRDLEAIYGAGNGRSKLNEILAAASPVMSGNVAKAGKFLDAVKKLEYSHIMQDIQLVARDMAALRKELSQHLSQGEVDAIVDVMFQAKKTEMDAGNPTNLRYRLDIDESYRHVLQNGKEFRISSLFENDSRLLVDKYINSMGGHIAMAEKGYRSRADFMKKMMEAEEYHTANQADTTDSAQYNRSKQLVMDMYDHITGRPMSTQSFNRGDRFLGAFRAYTRSAFLGQLGVAAAFEMKNAIALGTARAFWQQLPAFREFLTALRSGQGATTEMQEVISAMTGHGTEKVAGYARQHEVTEHTYDKGLNRFESASNKASHAVDIISGNSHFTSATRQLTAAIMIQKHYNMATGKLKISDKMRERMVGQGINADDLDDVLKDLKDHTVSSANGTVKEIRYEDWHRDNPTSYDNYITALDREVRDAIQDHDIGETMPWMHTTVGKIFSELRTFNLAAHSKQFMKGMHYRDQTMAIAWTMSFMGEALSYSVQQSINFSHNPEELDKRLTLERIAKGAYNRMAVLGIAPMLFETAWGVGSGGDASPLSGSTTNTDNRNLFKTPSGMLANKLYKGMGTVVGGINPLATNITTKQDVRDLMSTMPGGNTWGMRNLNDYISSQFPKSELRK